MLRENSKLNTIELRINKGFSYEKMEKLREKKTLLTLCQNRESSLSLKEHPCSLKIKAHFYFFKSKQGVSFNLVRDQANGSQLQIKTQIHPITHPTRRHQSTIQDQVS